MLSTLTRCNGGARRPRFRHSALLLLCFALFAPALLALSGCGGGGGSSNSGNSGGISRFVGAYTGSVNISAGRTGRYKVDVANDGSAQGTMEISDSSLSGRLVAALQGAVSGDTGRLTSSGSYQEGGRTVPVGIGGSLPTNASASVQSLAVTVDGVSLSGSVQSGTGFPDPPAPGGGTGSFPYSYTANGSALSGGDAGATITTYNGGRGVGVIMGGGTSSSPLLVLYVPAATGTYTMDTSDYQLRGAVFYPKGGDGVATNNYYTTIPPSGTNTGTVTITSISGSVAKGTFSFKVYKGDQSGSYFTLSGSFSAEVF